MNTGWKRRRFLNLRKIPGILRFLNLRFLNVHCISFNLKGSSQRTHKRAIIFIQFFIWSNITLAWPILTTRTPLERSCWLVLGEKELFGGFGPLYLLLYGKNWILDDLLIPSMGKISKIFHVFLSTTQDLLSGSLIIRIV